MTGSRFLRNLLVARVIAPEDFGIGATFALMAALLNSVSELGLDRKIIQDADGDDPRMQNTVHSMFLLRGVLMSLLMLALAPHAARLFGAADIAWAFRAVAILPMLRSFRHTDVVRFQRKLRFGPVQASEVIAHISVTLVAWPLAKFLGDFSALLWLAIMEAALATAFTHVFAERSYRLGWDVNRVRALIKFGWPLWLNGFLFFAIAQGDRAIVGSHVGLHALGIFAIAAGLARIPMTTAAGIAGQLLLPLMAEVQSNQKKFERRFELVTQLLWLIVGVLFVGIPIAGESLVRFLYGHDYAGAGIIAAWLAAVYGL
ncbi:MAG: oligosaccharide flippase family protein, partial [Planctomycetota bacterium]